MSAVRSKDTKPEMTVRRIAHELGFRFRLHRADLPGRPDIVFPGRHAVVFVHGCWWHGHTCARGARVPKANRDYWIAKVTRNKRRDESVIARLQAEGWRVLVVWECEINDRDALARTLKDFLVVRPSSLDPRGQAANVS